MKTNINTIITLGALSDIDGIEMLYNALNDHLACHTNYAGWRKDVYPTREIAESGVRDKTLYIAKQKDRFLGTVILNHTPEQNYDKVSWPSGLCLNEVYVIHTLAIHPECLRHGIGRSILEFAYNQARKDKMKALRLDVNDGNKPAIMLYEDFGFTHVDTIDIGLGEYGLKDFRVYEKLI